MFVAMVALRVHLMDQEGHRPDLKGYSNGLMHPGCGMYHSHRGGRWSLKENSVVRIDGLPYCAIAYSK